MASGIFRNVTISEPCPVCGGTDWCSWFPRRDGDGYLLSYQKMLTYNELMGSDAKSFKTDIFDVLSSFSSTDVFSAFKGFTTNSGTDGTEKPGTDTFGAEGRKRQEEPPEDTGTAVPVSLLIPDMAGKAKKRRTGRTISIPTRTLFDVV